METVETPLDPPLCCIFHAHCDLLLHTQLCVFGCEQSEPLCSCHLIITVYIQMCVCIVHKNEVRMLEK